MAEGNDFSPLGGLLSDCLESYGSQGGEAALSRRASMAWYSVNGDIERAHTVSVFVRPSPRRDQLPVLFVYVDSRTRAVDFSVNREIYLGRLAMAGLEFSEVRFLEDRRGRGRTAPGTPSSPREQVPRRPLPELSPEEARRVERMCAQLPERLRASASRAMSISLRRDLSERAEMVDMPSDDLSEPHKGYH